MNHKCLKCGSQNVEMMFIVKDKKTITQIICKNPECGKHTEEKYRSFDTDK